MVVVVMVDLVVMFFGFYFVCRGDVGIAMKDGCMSLRVFFLALSPNTLTAILQTSNVTGNAAPAARRPDCKL